VGWLAVAQLLSQYDQKVAMNVAYILDNSPVRIAHTLLLFGNLRV
jgi:hypothetical protein